MATPNENLATLESFWRWRGEFSTQTPKKQGEDLVYQNAYLTERQYKASVAMNELVAQAASNDHVRAAFAEANVFNTTLITENGTSILSAITLRDHDLQPRLVMLRGIKKAALGGFFSAQDPSGLSSWINSELLAATTIALSLKTEVLPDVILTMLALLKNAGVPLLWASVMTQPGGALDELAARISGTQWSNDARAMATYQRELQKGVDDVRGRYLAVLAAEAAKRLSTLPVRTGDGNTALTIPPEPKPLYARGEVLMPAIGGLGIGAWLVERRAR